MSHDEVLASMGLNTILKYQHVRSNTSSNSGDIDNKMIFNPFLATYTHIHSLSIAHLARNLCGVFGGFDISILFVFIQTGYGCFFFFF